MKQLKIITCFIIFVTHTSFAQNADDILGTYLLPNNFEVEIFKNNGKYFGEIVSLDNYNSGETKDVRNPDKTKRSDSLLGKVIVKDLKYDSENKEWINGGLYGPEKGINIHLRSTEAKKTEIVVVGSKLIFPYTMVWKKLF